jgi:hypothetical protein
MLVPLKRERFDELIPAVPTADQYQHYWGSANDVLRRVMVSVALLTVFALAYGRVTAGGDFSFNGLALLTFVGAGLGSLYWMLAPVAAAARRNGSLRRYEYAAFWIAEIWDVFLTEEVLGREEKVDRRGRLAVDFNTESYLNLVIGDDAWETTVQVPMRRAYKRIEPGQMVCLLIFANDPNFARIAKAHSDVYVPSLRLWLGDYPFLRRDSFEQLTRYYFRRR